MARFGGFPGLDMNKLMKQAQKMQEDAAKLQQDLQAARFEAEVGGGTVKVTVNGHGHPIGIKIDPIVADPNDIEMLEDLIITAFKAAAEMASSEQETRMESITGSLDGLNLPPGLL